jgi:hypothetical protein
VAGRHWLSAGSEGEVRTAAILSSLVSRCKALKLDPFAYLRDALDLVCTRPARQVGEWLPDRWTALQSGPESTVEG